MGTGWSYFINVCQAVRVAVAAAWTVVGLIAIYLVITFGLPQLQSALPAPAASSTTPTGTESNPQFAAPAVTSPRGSAARGVPGANPQFGSNPQFRSNPQFGSPAAQPPGVPPAMNSQPMYSQPMNGQPTNPQFAPAAPRAHRGSAGGLSGGQPNPQFKNPQFGGH